MSFIFRKLISYWIDSTPVINSPFSKNIVVDVAIADLEALEKKMED